MKNLAAAQGWQYHPGLYGKLTGTTNDGTPWTLEHTNVNDANFIWQSPIPKNEARLYISSKGGKFQTTLFTQMERCRVGSPQFQRKYFTAAVDQAALAQLLTPEVEQMLLNWPKLRLQMLQLRVSVRNGRLRITTRLSHQEESILQIVQLGEALLLTNSQ